MYTKTDESLAYSVLNIVDETLFICMFIKLRKKLKMNYNIYALLQAEF